LYLATNGRGIGSQIEKLMIDSTAKIGLLLLLLLLIPACGQIGPLYLPEPVEQTQTSPQPQSESQEEAKQDQ